MSGALNTVDAQSVVVIIITIIKTLLYGIESQGKIAITNNLHGEGNGNPLQYSSLDNPMDRGAW